MKHGTKATARTAAPNIPSSVAAGDKVTIAFDVAANCRSPSPPRRPTHPTVIAQPPVTDPFQYEVMYFVMPDRFYNGRNDNDTSRRRRLDHGFDVTDKGFYHGGDLGRPADQDGLPGKPGVTSIWMTPMFKTTRLRKRRLRALPRLLDHRLHPVRSLRNAELEAMIDEAHSRDIKVLRHHHQPHRRHPRLPGGPVQLSQQG